MGQTSYAMKTTSKTEVFDSHVAEYEAWYESHPEVYASELEAIRVHFNRLPEKLHGIEVGLGTGRFAAPLGIKEGVEPSLPMAEKARMRGIEVMEALAESLPYADMQFDFVLLVTLCHLENPKYAIQEAFRVLKPGGALIAGFLPADRPIAREYRQRRPWTTFYKDAQFYSVARIASLLEESGFRKLEFSQTLFGEVESIREIQMPESGSERGSFVAVSALKP